MGKKEEDDKKAQQKQNSATIMISVDGKRRVLPLKLKSHKTNYQINMTSDHSASSNSSLKAT